MMAKLNLKDKKFGKLTVIEEYGKDKRNQILWKCLCECGNITYVTTYRLNKGKTLSCGCLMSAINSKQAYLLGKNNKKHGMSNARIYKIYYGLRERCLNTNSSKYKDYGQRGIKISSEWDSFDKFYEWAMKNGYNDKLTIDRIDVNGDYEPCNCRWADMNTQGNNRRNNRIFEINGSRKTLSELSRQSNLKAGTISARIDRYNIPLDKAIIMDTYEHKKKRGKKVKVINIETGEIKNFMSIKKAYEQLGGNYSTIRYCFQKNKVYLNKYKIEEV